MTYILKSGQAGKADYTPYGAIREAFLCHDPEIILAGGADTGKTLGMLNKIHILACKYSNASIVILRKRQTDVYSTTLQTFQKKVLHEGAPVKVFGGEHPQWFDYDNGSRIWVTGLYSPAEAQVTAKVLGGEHDVVLCDQVEELSLPEWETLLSRVTGRAGHMPYAQVIGTCNPAGPTHWIRTRAKSGKLTLFESTHRDNPELFDPATQLITLEGEKRLGRLKALSGARLMRLYHGLWVSPEGAIFDVFDEDRHKVRAFPVPPLWPRIVGIDPMGAYTAAVWLAFDPGSGVVHAYREYYQPFGLTTAGHARAILDLSRQETVFAWVGGGPSERQQREDFAGAGIPLLAPPVSDVWATIDRVYQLLKDTNLVIHDSCPELLSEIGDYRRKLKDGEPTEVIESKETYHMVDCLRYGCAFLLGPQEQTDVVYRPVQIGRGW
jgi:hypothetical protein